MHRYAMAAGVLAALGLAVPVEAGIGVISVNQHETEIDTGCRYCPVESTLCTQGCTEDVGGCRFNATVSDPNANPPRVGYENASTAAPPFSQIATNGDNVDVFSYHVNPWTNSTNPPTVFRRWKGRACQALAEYTFSARAKILSTDMPDVETLDGNNGDGTDVAFYLDLVCRDAATGSRRGRMHFEHYDRWLNAESEAGACINGWSAFVSRSRNALNAIDARSDCGVNHHPNGLLFRGTSIDPNNRHKLYFSQPRGAANAPATVLKGYGFMGALSIGQRLDPEKYFRILGWKGVNLTRVWAVERWNGRVPGTPTCAPGQSEGPTPFEGTWELGDYRLDRPNEDFYKGLRKFVQEAADRGIVVQLSLYDVHGLLNYTLAQGQTECPGRFSDSPYNSQNNDNGYIGSSPSDCGLCSEAFAGEEAEARSGNCKGPNGFVQNGSLQANHLAYVRRVAEEVGGMGNVMFEIINEAMAGLDWWNVTPRGDDWQLQQAENLRKALPIRVVRDAFNDVWTSGSSRYFTLGGSRVPDSKVSGFGNWTASNVRIVQTRDLVTDGETISTNTWLGYATSDGNIGSSTLWARLPFPEPTQSTWTDLNVRARLTGSTGAVGFDISKESGGGGVGVTFRPADGTLELWGSGNACLTMCSFGTIAVSDATTKPHEFRLKLTRLSSTDFLASVFVDGDTTTLAEVPVTIDSGSSSFAEVGFSGSGSLGSYPPGTHQIDNFEANYICLTCDAAVGDDPGPVEDDSKEES
jgi:hypothetical protein